MGGWGKALKDSTAADRELLAPEQKTPQLLMNNSSLQLKKKALRESTAADEIVGHEEKEP